MNVPQREEKPITIKIGYFNVLICFGLIVGISAGCTKSQPGPPAASNRTVGFDSIDSEPTIVTEEPEADSDDTPKFGPAPDGKVLRHAVFFSFKEESSEDDIQGVVDAFRELPAKITEITDLRWGVNNSPEDLDDGFTHCFLLTFKDEAGRAAYIPHEAHAAFGNVLRPHNDKVFVFDYWGNANAEPLEKELKHAVFFRFKKGADEEGIRKVEAAFADLPSKIDTIKRFEWGVNNSPEKHAAGFTHCFMVSFDSEEGRATYLEHPEHLAFVEVLKPVLEAPRVLDFWAQK